MRTGSSCNVRQKALKKFVGCAMRTGSSCRVHQKALKKSTSTHFDGIKVNWCLRPTLQITKFQAFLALKSKLSTHARQDWVRNAHRLIL